MRLRINELRDAGAIDQNTADKLWDLPAVNKGDGRYRFMAGDAEVVDAAGRPVTIDFTTTPFVTSGGNTKPTSMIVPPTEADKRYREWLRGAGR